MQHEEGFRRTISIVEAGRWLGIGRTLAYAAAQRGEIPTIRIGRVLRVPVVQLEAMLSGKIDVPAQIEREADVTDQASSGA